MFIRLLFTFCFLITLHVNAVAVACHDQSPAVLVLGDSLSAGFGIDQNKGWVKLLKQQLVKDNYSYQVINASISGDTTSGGLARLNHALERYKPSIVIVELGGNDGLQGLPITEINKNLAAIITKCRNHGAKVLLIGMRLPPNYGINYTKSFHEVYVSLAKQFHVPLVPFLLEGVATHAEMMQEDGIHPREIAQPMLLKNVWAQLRPLLDKSGTK